MKIEGGCYCKAVRYEAEGEPSFRGECLCRECRTIAGGNSNYFMVMPAAGFRYTKGQPKSFTRSDIANPVTREFCPECGTHLTTRPRAGANTLVLKVGTLDDPSLFGGAEAVLFASEKESYHRLPEGVTIHPRFPGR